MLTVQISRLLLSVGSIHFEVSLSSMSMDVACTVRSGILLTAKSVFRFLSPALMTFIDAFGLYRNAQRSLMGIYNIIAAFDVQERNRRQNVLPLTLGPHGSNLDDVVHALKSLIPLDEGIPPEIKGMKTTVFVFILCFIGDMP